MLPDGGRYQLLLRLAADCRLTVGRLGTFDLPAGYYVYTGSMVRGLRHRLARHARRDKPLRWHIDYLTAVADLIDQRVSPAAECALAAEAANLPGATIAIPRFGASDCGCAGHLARLPDRAAWERLLGRPA